MVEYAKKHCKYSQQNLFSQILSQKYQLKKAICTYENTAVELFFFLILWNFGGGGKKKPNSFETKLSSSKINQIFPPDVNT